MTSVPFLIPPFLRVFTSGASPFRMLFIGLRYVLGRLVIHLLKGEHGRSFSVASEREREREREKEREKERMVNPGWSSDTLSDLRPR